MEGTGRGAQASLPATDRLVLEGVPPIGYVVGGKVRLCPFPGALESAMEYIGDPCSYDDVMATSGGAFRRFFNRDDGGNVSLEYTAPFCYQRAMRALGHRYSAHRMAPRDAGRAELAENRLAILAVIRRSLAQGRPVLASVAGPECGLVCGYEQGGDALLGWSYFRDVSGGYYRAENWHRDRQAGSYVLAIEEKIERPSERQTLVATLDWAVRLSRAPASDLSTRPLPEHSTGLAACEAWAAGLEEDADFPADDARILETRSMVHSDQCDMTTDRRHAATYLKRMAAACPEAARPLGLAADLYGQVAELAGSVRAATGTWQDPAAFRVLADRTNRQRFAAGVHAIRDKESAAVAELERALTILRPTT